MPTIKFVSADGKEQEVEAEVGTSIMQVALDNMVDGILADCGGGCSCATCHCYVDHSIVGEPNALEESMLEMALDPKENSRLSCQIDVTEEMDGLVVNLPESQF